MNTDLNRHKTMRHESPEQRVSLVREMFARVLEHAKQLNVEVRLQSSLDLEKPGASTVGFELKALAVALLVMIALPAVASEVHLAWDSSPGVTNHVLFVAQGTNTAKLNVGTNTAATIDLAPAIYYVTVRAQQDGIESDPSNSLVFQVPKQPNLRLVIVEATTDLTGTNWQQVGFVRLRIP